MDGALDLDAGKGLYSCQNIPSYRVGSMRFFGSEETPSVWQLIAIVIAFVVALIGIAICFKLVNGKEE